MLLLTLSYTPVQRCGSNKVRLHRLFSTGLVSIRSIQLYGGYNYDSTSIQLSFDCNSTALRPFETVVRVLGAAAWLNKQVGETAAAGVSAASDVLRHCDLSDLSGRPSNGRRIEVVTVAFRAIGCGCATQRRIT